MSPGAILPTTVEPLADLPRCSHDKRYQELDASRMVISLVSESQQQRVPELHDPVRMTQKCTTAHMIQVQWEEQEGWGIPKMGPYEKIALEPTASVLHYATESFEGMKAYRGYDGKLRLFRPHLNCQRMIKSNERVCLPGFDTEQLLAIIEKFLSIECPRWLPKPGSNLYIRPAVIGSGSALGIQKPPEALLFIFAALFPQQPPSGSPPSPGIKLLASDPETSIRAWPGGFGSAKVGASYGPAMVAQAKARQKKCSQTLWLYGKDKLVTEAGASNFFVIWKRKDSDMLELVTSSLDTDIILDGITRRSILELARERLSSSTTDGLFSDLPPLEVVERPFTIDEIIEAHTEGRLVESFVSGTAMFISSVSGIHTKDAEILFPTMVTSEGQKSPISKYASVIKGWLEDIMYGRVKHGWAFVIEE